MRFTTQATIIYILLAVLPSTFICAQTSDIIWMNGDTRSVNSFKINTEVNTQLLQGTVSNPRHIELDKKNGKIYWADPTLKKISRSNLDGSLLEEVVSFSGNVQFEGLAIDTLNEKLYWRTFGNGIERANLDGSLIENILGGAGNGDIALDPANNALFWTTQVEVGRADLDGTNVVTLATIDNDFRSDLEIDVTNQHLYFGDNNANAIFRIDTDGNNLTTVINQTGFFPQGIGLDVENSLIYSFDRTSNVIRRVNFDGSGFTTISNELVTQGGFIDSDVEFLNGLVYTSRPTQILTVDPNDASETNLITSEIAAPTEVTTSLNQLFITDFDNGTIVSYDVDLGVTSELIGSLNTPLNILSTRSNLYWTSGGGTVPTTILRSSLDGSNQTTIFFDGDQRPNDFDVDENNGFVYFSVANWINNIGQIRRVPIEGGADELVVASSNADQIAINHSTQEIYWNEGSQLFKANLDGSNVQEIIVSDFFPNDIKIDQIEQKLYWSDGSFRRVNLDGSNPEIIGSSSGVIEAFTLYDSLNVANLLQPALESDSLALVDFYNSTGGPNWTNSNNWLEEGKKVAEWYGVEMEGGRVVSLDFFGTLNQIIGEIPVSLADLSELRTLNLSSNRLTGSFPIELTNLTNLETLNLAFNIGLTGEIPSLDALTSLVIFDITNSSFEDLPDLTGISSLMEVYASGNRFEFDDIEPNIAIPFFDYTFQQEFTSDTITYDLAATYIISPTTPGTANIYQWLLNGDTIPGQTSNLLTINPGENGDYELLVENSIAPNLTLSSGVFRFTDTPPFLVNSETEIFTYQIQTGIDETLKNTTEVIDANGDGIRDLAVAFGRTMNYYSGGNRISSIPTVSYQTTDPVNIINVASGRFNSDTFHDVAIAIGEPNNYETTSRIVLMQGGSNLSESTVQFQEISYNGSNFNLASLTGSLNIITLGDINNDGFEDLGVSTSGNATAIQILFGGQSTFGGLSTQVDVSAASFAHRLFKLGDINNDSFDDFGVANVSSGEYFIFFGGDGKTDFLTPDLTISLAGSLFDDGQTFFGWTTLVSDVNNNDQPDILIRSAFARDPVITSVGVNSVFIVYGGSELDNIIDDAIRLPASPLDPTFVASNSITDFQNIGDYNDDGVDDLLVSSFGETPDAYIFPSENLAESSIPATTFKAPAQATLGSRNNFINFQASNAKGDFNDNGLLEVVLGQQTETGYNLYFFENFEPPGDRFYDSLALVNFYQNTNGDNWTSSTNWLVTDMDFWEGVSLTTGRVSVLELPGNNLEGSIPDQLGNLLFLERIDLSNNQIEGALTETIANLTSITDINLSNNEISEIPDLNTFPNTVTLLNLSSNRLDFADLEPVYELTFLNYANQKNFQLASDSVLAPVTTDATVNVAIGGNSLSYQWRYKENTITGATDSTYIVQSIDRSNMGDYSVVVNSGLITDLTLTSDPVAVLATAVVTVNVTGFDSNLIAESVSGALMETIRGDRGYDTLSVLNDVSSSFTFEPIVLNDFLVGVTSDPEKYVDTYFENVFLWEEADTLELLSDTTIQIIITSVPEELTPEDGEGEVSGSIEEDFSEDEARVSARRRASKRKCGLRRKRTGGRTGQDDDFELIAYGETDENGEFKFGFLPQGTYRFFVEYPGIPLDESSFVQFDIGEAGVSDDSFVLAAVVTETGIVVELILGITSEYFTSFNIYPNPTSNILHIDYDKIVSEKVIMDIVDMNGNSLTSKELRKGKDGKVEINLENYKKGQYILRFFDPQKGKAALIFRVIKR